MGAGSNTATRLIRVTKRFRMMIIGSMLAIFVLYMATWIISLFNGSGTTFLTEPSAFNIGLSVLIVGIASFNLMLQFGGPLAIVAVLVFVIGGVIALFHYIVWGWWLGRTIREEVEAMYAVIEPNAAGNPSRNANRAAVVSPSR